LRSTGAADSKGQRQRWSIGNAGVVSPTPLQSTVGIHRLLVFALDDLRYGLLISSIERVVRIVEITRLPRAPAIVCGIVNFAGNIIPVVDIRKRFNLPSRDVRLSDQLILARTARRSVALRVDRVESLAECNDKEFVAADAVLTGLEYVRGVAKLENGIVLIHDLDTFLSLDEEENLRTALAETGT
jgi:purine-binding chemotaxis protein CheW